MMKINVKITKDILKKSMYCGHNADDISSNCALALAVREIWPHASIGGRRIYPFYFENGMESTIRNTDSVIDTPSIARRFIILFDTKSPQDRLLMPEIEVVLEVPSSIIEKVGISQIYKVLSESKTLECIGL